MKREHKIWILRLVLPLIILLTTFSLSYSAPTVDSPNLDPGVIRIGVPTQVTVTVKITDPTLIPSSVNLQRLDQNNNVIGVLGNLNPVGNNIFSITKTFNESVEKSIYLRVSAGFRGLMKRVFSSTITLQTVKADGAGFIGSSGGLVQVTDPSSPLLGVAVEIPENSLSGNSIITIALEQNPPPPPPGSNPASLPINFETSNDLTGYVALKIPVALPQNENQFPEARYYDEISGQWELLPSSYYNYEDGYLIVYTYHFTVIQAFYDWWVDYKKSADIGFNLGSDSLLYDNKTNNCGVLSDLGLCSGMSAWVSWYFDNIGHGIKCKYSKDEGMYLSCWGSKNILDLGVFLLSVPRALAPGSFTFNWMIDTLRKGETARITMGGVKIPSNEGFGGKHAVVVVGWYSYLDRGRDPGRPDNEIGYFLIADGNDNTQYGRLYTKITYVKAFWLAAEFEYIPSWRYEGSEIRFDWIIAMPLGSDQKSFMSDEYDKYQTVSSCILTSISVTPATATVTLGSNQQFTATAFDQYGNPIIPQPSFTWASSNVSIGTVDATGMFIGVSAGGPITITASVGSVSGSASVTVGAPPLPSETWAKTYYGVTFSNRSSSSIQQTSDGGYIVAGRTFSFGAGHSDFWLLKLDTNGNIQWQKAYGDSGNDLAHSVQQTSDGGYIVAGYSNVCGFSCGDYQLKEGYLVLKLDSSGNIQWQKRYYSSFFDPQSVQETSDGGYIVAGQGDDPGVFWALKLDNGGNIQWQKAYGSSSGASLYSIQQTPDGGYITAGGSNAYGFSVLKLDNSGNIQWQKAYGQWGWASSVQQTFDGGYIVAGTTNLNLISPDTMDFWLLKLDNSGNIQWQKAYGGTGYDLAHSVHQTTDGGYIVGGTTCSFGSCGLWLLKLDSNGNISFNPSSGAFTTNTNVTPSDTFLPVIITNVVVNQQPNLISIDTSITPIDTNATVSQQAP